jgi:hypothetical protein
MRALTFVVAWWALSALLGRTSWRIGLLRAMVRVAAVALGWVVIDFFAFGAADPWRELYHGGPGPLPIRLLVVFCPKLIGLVLLSVPAMALGQSRYFADRPRRRAAVVLAVVAFAAAVLLPTVRFARAYEWDAVLLASAQQGLMLVSTTDLGTVRSPASIVEHQVIARVGRSLSHWTGSAFEPLSDAESRRLEPLIADRLAAPAGWTVQPLGFSGQPKDLEFLVAGVQRRLHSCQISPAGALASDRPVRRAAPGSRSRAARPQPAAPPRSRRS